MNNYNYNILNENGGFCEPMATNNALPGHHQYQIEHLPYYTPSDNGGVFGNYLLYLPRISEPMDIEQPNVVIDLKKSKRKTKLEKRNRHRCDMDNDIQELKRNLCFYQQQNKLLEQDLRQMVLRKKFLERLYSKCKCEFCSHVEETLKYYDVL